MRLLAREHVTEHDPVVIPVRLVPEHRDRELRRSAARQYLLDDTGTCHAIADHNQATPVVVSGSDFTWAFDAWSSVLDQPKIDNQVTGQAERRDQLQLHDRAAFDVLHDPQRHVNVALAPMGKYRIGTPSRIRTTVISSSVVLPPGSRVPGRSRRRERGS